MSWFCKHEWDYIDRATEKEATVTKAENGGVCVTKPFTLGVCVYCRKCGKQNHRFSKKLNKLYGTHLRYEIIDNVANATKEYFKTIKYKIPKFMENK